MKISTKNFFKKIFVSLAVSSIVVTGTAISGLAAYVQVGLPLSNFQLSAVDSTSFGIGYVGDGTQIDQLSSYPTIFNNKSYSEGMAYARSSGSNSSFGFGEYYIQKNNPSPYVYRYVGVAAGNCTHYWSNTGGGGFRVSSLTVYRYTT